MARPVDDVPLPFRVALSVGLLPLLKHLSWSQWVVKLFIVSHPEALSLCCVNSGTTYSCVGVWKNDSLACFRFFAIVFALSQFNSMGRCGRCNGKPVLVCKSKDGVEIIANDQGNRTTPSYVGFTDTERLIGDAAKNQVARNPENTVPDWRD